MKKRIISMLLVLVLTLSICAVGAVGTTAADAVATVRVGGQNHTVKVGDYFAYEISFRYTGSKLATAQVELPVDFNGLSGYTQDEISTHILRIAPAAPDNSVVLRSEGGNTLGINGYVMNFVSPGGISFSSQKVVLSLIFGVEKAGTYDLSAKVRFVDDVSDYTVVDSNYTIKDSRFRYTESVTDVQLDTPQLKVSTGAGGMNISWDPVPRAQLYRVYYKGRNGWTRLGDTTETSFLDTDVSNGTRYTYTVRCLSPDASKFVSDYDTNGKSAVYYEAPILKLSNMEDGVKLTWNAVSGASKYRVYYKGSSGWTRLADTTGTSAVDDDVLSGNTYTYTIRTMDANGNFLSWYYADAFRIRFIRAPEFSLSNAANGVKISWNTVGGAGKYRVFYYGSNGWTRLADTSETSFVDTDVRSNSTYTYTVRCISLDGSSYISDFRAGKKIKYYAAPKLTLSNAADGVNIKWDAVAGASKYRVYYKGSGGWTKLTDTTGTSAVDADVASGTTYTYTIRAMDANNNHLSWYYTDGFSIKFVRAPEVTLSNAADGVKINWNKVEGAEKYRVYYYGSSGWTKLTDTTDTSFVDTDVTSNRSYTYTVRCINAEGTAFASYFRSGKTIKYYATPSLVLSNTSAGVNIKWTAVSGASKYRLYYKTASGWTKLTDTASTSYTDTSVTNGTTRTYTARAMDGSNNHLSWYYPDGFTITYQK